MKASVLQAQDVARFHGLDRGRGSFADAVVGERDGPLENVGDRRCNGLQGLRGVAPLGLTHEFPSARTVARADLSGLGLTGARQEALRGFASAMASGELVLDRGSGLDATVRALCALPGIGPWTANYVAMRACGERDAFPASDLALRKVLGPDTPARAEGFRPWRAYGAMHIWQAPHALAAGAATP